MELYQRDLLWRCAVTQTLLVAASIPVFFWRGLSIDARGSGTRFMLVVLVALLWIYYARFRPDRFGLMAASTLGALFAIVCISNVLSLLQYPAAALRRPLIDPWLASADVLMGIDVGRLAAWTSARPAVARTLLIAYLTLLPQFGLTVLLHGVAFKDHRALWEYVFHFHFCAVGTVLGLAFFPAQCAFLYHGFRPTFDQTRFINHFTGLRSGEMTVIRLDNIEGLISMPSFHVAGALMVTWSFRRRPAVLAVLVPLNVALIIATFMSGAHYFVDVPGTALLFGLSLLAHRRWSRRFADASHVSSQS